MKRLQKEDYARHVFSDLPSELPLGTPSATKPSRRPDMWIGNYKVIGMLGVGGMGTVFKARDREDRSVALKIIGNQLDFLQTLSVTSLLRKGQAFDVARRIALVKEASTAMGLRHPNIVTVFDYGQHRGLLYIVMEYLEGRSLAQVIAARHLFTLGDQLEIIAQVCDALGFAHERKVIHRDIKPANVFLTAEGVIKVLDFGIAERPFEWVKRRRAIVGTLPYMAPELISGRLCANSRTDIWAIGVMLYEIVTGQNPFATPDIRQLFRSIVSMPTPRFDTKLPAAEPLQDLLDRMLSKDPLERLSSARKVASELRQFINSLPLSGDGVIRRPGSIRRIAASGDLGRSASVARTSSIGASELVDIRVGQVKTRKLKLWFAGFDAETYFWAAVRPVSLGLTGANIVSILQGWQMPPWSLLAIPAVLLPLLILGPFWFILTVLEKVNETPRCRGCGLHMTLTRRITRFALNDSEVVWGLSDCVSALKADLWEDAIKLLSLHGHETEPLLGNRVVTPPIRYHLEFFDCKRCSHSYARVTTDDRDPDWETWTTRPAHMEAYRGKVKSRSKAAVLTYIWQALVLTLRAVPVACRSMKVSVKQAVWAAGLLFAGIFAWRLSQHNRTF